jgi:hypothetical protein
MIADIYSTRVVNAILLSNHYQGICIHGRLTDSGLETVKGI